MPQASGMKPFLFIPSKGKVKEVYWMAATNSEPALNLITFLAAI